MKQIVFILTIFIVSNAYASSQLPCEIEYYFQQTDAYKSSVFDNEAKQLDLEREMLTLLPDINVSIGQQSTNKSSFKGLNDSSISLGLSQTVYNGGRYRIYKDKIAKDIEYNNLVIQDKRNRYLVDLYRSVIEYNYKADLHKLYVSQLNKQTEQLDASLVRVTSGDIAKIEYDIIKLRKEELQNEVDKIESEISQTELDIMTLFNIPPELIKKITSKEILSCKMVGTGYILDKSRKLRQQNENADYNLRMTSMRPNVSLSLHMRPPFNGTLSDVTTRKTEFVAGVNVTIPVSSFFSVNNIQKDHAISINRIDDTYNEKDKLYMREKENVTSKLKNIKRNIELTRKKIEIKGKEVDYVLSRFREKKDTIMSYYRQLDEYENEIINLKKDEREYEYYKTYINILD